MSSRDDGPNDLLLSEQACFALYSASRAVTDVYRPILADLGLTYPQYLVLLVLWESEPRTVKQIAESLLLDYGTVSPLLKRLEAHGLVVRRRAESDERTVCVDLTDAGRALRSGATGIPTSIGCAMGLDDRTRRELVNVLRAVTASTREFDADRPAS